MHYSLGRDKMTVIRTVWIKAEWHDHYALDISTLEVLALLTRCLAVFVLAATERTKTANKNNHKPRRTLNILSIVTLLN